MIPRNDARSVGPKLSNVPDVPVDRRLDAIAHVETVPFAVTTPLRDLAPLVRVLINLGCFVLHLTPAFRLRHSLNRGTIPPRVER